MSPTRLTSFFLKHRIENNTDTSIFEQDNAIALAAPATRKDLLSGQSVSDKVDPQIGKSILEHRYLHRAILSGYKTWLQRQREATPSNATCQKCVYSFSKARK